MFVDKSSELNVNEKRETNQVKRKITVTNSFLRIQSVIEIVQDKPAEVSHRRNYENLKVLRQLLKN